MNEPSVGIAMKQRGGGNEGLDWNSGRLNGSNHNYVLRFSCKVSWCISRPIHLIVMVLQIGHLHGSVGRELRSLVKMR